MYALKAMMALFDLGALGMLLALLRLTGRPEVWALAYGWCPLALKEYAQTGHFDPVATFFLLASLYTLARGRRALAGILAGFGIGAKLFPAVFVAVAWRRFGARGIALAAAALALLAWPYAGDGIRAFAGIGTYGMQWVGNASVFALVAWLFSPLGRLGLSTAMAAKVVLGALGAAGLFAVSRRPEATPAQLADKALVAVGMLFVLSPVQNPWYAGWLLPLAALSGRISWLVLSGTMVTYYAWFSASSYWRVVPGLGLPVDLRWLEYAPFFALLWLESRSYSEEESSRMDAPRPV
ncbi:MAG: DUF2029 domain-containing protein [Candidatus Wallbacteria bacterium]|nr:DUF2029 domain-containing protein [Candidatus Wallbacteria bacterium]